MAGALAVGHGAGLSMDGVLGRGGTTTYTYDLVGNLLGQTLPNGVQTVAAYNSQNRLTQLATVLGNLTLASYAYTLNAVGQRTQVVEGNGRHEHL
jgi:YD repeat-containing protein